MSRTVHQLSVLIVLCLFAGFAPAGDPPGIEPTGPDRAAIADYFKDGKLKDKLTLRIDHRADRSGRSFGSSTWELDPSGKWTQTDADSNFGIRPPFVRVVARGQLAPAQLAALAQHLATQGFNTLPARVGTEPAPEERLVGVTLGFGQRSTTLDTEQGALTDGRPGAGTPGANEWSRFVVLTLVVQELFRESKVEPKPTVPTNPLKMRLVARKGTYTLDLGGLTPEEFRKRLARSDPFGRDLLPAPVVDLLIEITNTSDKPVTIMIGGDDAPLRFELKGPGAVSTTTFFTTLELRISQPVTIAPGKSFTHPVTRLASYPRYKTNWYWTEPGEYTLTAHWQLGEPKRGEPGPALKTEPVVLKVVAPSQMWDYLKDVKLKERIEVRDVWSGFNGSGYRYCAIETDGTWSSGTGIGTPFSKRTETARGKLTPEQLLGLMKDLARYDLASLPDHGEMVFDPSDMILERGLATSAIEIQFGKKTLVLYPGAGKTPPEEDRAIRARYDGIVRAVEALCRNPEKPDQPGAGGKGALVREIDLKGYAPDETDGDPTRPTRISTLDELAKVVPNPQVRKQIAEQVDFDKEELLFFAWTGSNTDSLSFEVELTKYGPVAVFHFVKGGGQDRPHPKCRVYAVAKNWRVERSK
jgi:hypothetical protein